MATKPKSTVAVVFSNGTGVFFDEDTRIEVKKFEQEPFVPNRTDTDVEPSMSQTQAFVPRGTVGLCTSKLVAGSNMTYKTQLGAVNIRGGKVVIQSFNNETKISMLEATARSRRQRQHGRPSAEERPTGGDHSGSRRTARPGGDPGDPAKRSANQRCRPK